MLQLQKPAMREFFSNIFFPISWIIWKERKRKQEKEKFGNSGTALREFRMRKEFVVVVDVE